MPVRRRLLRNASRWATGNGNNVDERVVVLLRIVADGELGRVGRDAVIVIAAGGNSCVDLHGIVPADWEALDAAIAIEQERSAIMRPVGSLETPRREIRHTAVGGVDVYRFERTVENRLGSSRRGLRQFDIGKDCLFLNIFVVRADAESHVESAL